MEPSTCSPDKECITWFNYPLETADVSIINVAHTNGRWGSAARVGVKSSFADP